MAGFEGTMLNVNLSNCTIKKSKIVLHWDGVRSMPS